MTSFLKKKKRIIFKDKETMCAILCSYGFVDHMVMKMTYFKVIFCNVCSVAMA